MVIMFCLAAGPRSLHARHGSNLATRGGKPKDEGVPNAKR